MEGTPATQPQFEITRQEHLQEYDSAGNPVESWRITFNTLSTPTPIQSFVTVPMNEYTPDNVAKLIQERVSSIVAVQALGR